MSGCAFKKDEKHYPGHMGIYTDLHNDAYHGDKYSISRSGIMDFIDSPYKYWANYINPNRKPKEQTPQMMFGEAFHTLMLEPETFSTRFVVEPELQKSPPRVLLKNVGRPAFDAYKAAKAKVDFMNDRTLEDFGADSEGKKILTQAEFKILQEMQDALWSNPRARNLIEGAVYEQSYFWEDEHSGLIVKARPDILHRNMIVDLKTCKSAHPRAFQSAMVDGGYHTQGAIIRDGVRVLEGRDIPNVINIAIEKTYPYSIGIYIIDEFALEHGHMKYKQVLLDLKHAIAHNEFPDYDVQTISLPKWAL